MCGGAPRGRGPAGRKSGIFLLSERLGSSGEAGPRGAAVMETGVREPAQAPGVREGCCPARVGPPPSSGTPRVAVISQGGCGGPLPVPLPVRAPPGGRQGPAVGRPHTRLSQTGRPSRGLARAGSVTQSSRLGACAWCCWVPVLGKPGRGGAAGRVGRGGETGPLAGREGMERRWPGGGQRQRQRRQRPTVTGRGLGQLWLRQGWLPVRCRLVGPWWAGACVVPGTGVPLAQQPWGWPWSPCGGVACSAGSGLLSASESPLGGELRPGGHLRGPQPRESSCVLALPCAQESVIEKPPRPGAG